MDRRSFTTFVLAIPPVLLASRAEAQPRPKSSSDAARAAAIVSQIRMRNGQNAVSIDPRMNAAAEYQARACSRLGQLSHGDFAGRVRQFGLRGAAAENLAYGTNDVAGAIAQWQGSSPHLRNLLMPGATRMGIGRADAGSTRYWAMVIG